MMRSGNINKVDEILDEENADNDNEEENAKI